MDKEDQNYSAGLPASFGSLDYTLDHHHHQQQQQHQQQQLIQSRFEENSGDSNAGMVDYMLSNPPPQQASPGFFNSSCLDRLNFSDVMQFADFGPKLGLNQANNISDGENGIDDQVYFLKFPVLSDKLQDNSLMIPSPATIQGGSMESMAKVAEAEEEKEEREETGGQVSENASSVRLRILAGSLQKNPSGGTPKNKRKRPRSIKTSEEVESQRMTHIAVERNRRKQMNEHLRVLRSLMPGSYVQRGDQASIIGGAIEFVRELEQLLQCLESQKRRRLYGGGDQAPRPIESPLPIAQAPQEPQFFPCMPLPNDQFKLAADFEAGIREETAENKSFLADVEVKLLGFDAMIKILSRRRPGQLLKTIAALEDLQLSILHTNITTIEQTVLYSFNVKVSNESRFTADDIANSVQQIFNFIHASTTTTNSI